MAPHGWQDGCWIAFTVMEVVEESSQRYVVAMTGFWCPALVTTPHEEIGTGDLSGIPSSETTCGLAHVSKSCFNSAFSMAGCSDYFLPGLQRLVPERWDGLGERVSYVHGT